jgi:hypothetical protein
MASITDVLKSRVKEYALAVNFANDIVTCDTVRNQDAIIGFNYNVSSKSLVINFDDTLGTSEEKDNQVARLLGLFVTWLKMLHQCDAAALHAIVDIQNVLVEFYNNLEVSNESKKLAKEISELFPTLEDEVTKTLLSARGEEGFQELNENYENKRKLNNS